MPSRSPRKGRARYSDPSNASLTPLTGAFSRLSNSSRAHSLSPRKSDAKQPLHIRMNLTETQMNRITAAFTRSVDGNSPRKDHETSPPKSTMRGHKSSSSRRVRMDDDHFHGNDNDASEVTCFEDLMARPTQQHASTVSLAERRQRSTPAPIHVNDARRFVRATPKRARMENVPDGVSPLNAREMYNAGYGLESQSSFYPSEHHSSQQPEPLNICRSENCDVSPTSNNPFESHDAWLEDSEHREAPKTHLSRGSPSKQRRRSKSSDDAFRNRARGLSVSPSKEAQNLENADTSAFSPFPYYFRAEDFPEKKWAHKTMIGEKGWLERTEKSPDKTKRSTAKKMGIIDGIKKIAKDMTDQYHPGRRANSAHVMRGTLNSQTTVTLNAREQSLLYCELEFNLCNSLNAFIKIQLDKGRVDTNKLKKIGDAWIEQGRPRVVGFRYDLETQLELITLHIDDFVFSGRRQGNPTEIAALLYTMKVNARAMRIKTFCSPDSVLAKQLVDSQSLFNLIGAPSADNYALEECAHFYNLCLDREAERQAKEAKNMRMSKAEGWAHVKAWESRRDTRGACGQHREDYHNY